MQCATGPARYSPYLTGSCRGGSGTEPDRGPVGRGQRDLVLAPRHDLPDRRDRAQVSHHRLDVAVGQPAIEVEGHRRPESPPVAASALADRPDHLVVRPPADPGLGIRRDVRRDPGPELLLEPEAPREVLLRQVACRTLGSVAVAAGAQHLDQVAPALDRALGRRGQGGSGERGTDSPHQSVRARTPPSAPWQRLGSALASVDDSLTVMSHGDDGGVDRGRPGAGRHFLSWSQTASISFRYRSFTSW